MIELEHAYKDLALYISNPQEFKKRFPAVKRQELFQTCANMGVTQKGFKERFAKIWDEVLKGKYDHLHW